MRQACLKPGSTPPSPRPHKPQNCETKPDFDYSRQKTTENRLSRLPKRFGPANAQVDRTAANTGLLASIGLGVGLMTKYVGRHTSLRTWRFLGNVFYTAIIAGMCYVTVLLMMMWSQEFVNTGTVRPLIP